MRAIATPAELLARLPGDGAALPAARAHVAERRLSYPCGSGEAEEIAAFAGLKPVVRQSLRRDDLPRAREKFRDAALHVEEREATVHGGRVLIYAGKDAARVKEAANAEQRDDRVAVGVALGYPPCCVRAFAAVPGSPRHTAVVRARTVAATHGPGVPELNVLDPAVFHFVSWMPCTLTCASSAALARATLDAVRAHLAKSPAGVSTFVDDVRDALSATRLVVLDDVQLSLRGTSTPDGLCVAEVWPTARDRHPTAALDADAAESVARLLALVERGDVVSVGDGVVRVGARLALPVRDAVMARFA